MTKQIIHLNYSWNEIGFSVHYKRGDNDTWHLYDLFKIELSEEKHLIAKIKSRIEDSGKLILGKETRINVMQDD